MNESGTRPRDQAQAIEDELLGTFLALMPDAAVVVDAKGLIVSMNEHTTAMFGYTEAELLGEPVERLVPERFRQRHRAHRQGYAAQPRARAMGAGQDLVGRRADGSEFAIDISLAPVGVTERPLVVAAIRDATDRRTAVAAQSQLAAIVQSSLDGIVAMTTDGIVRSWNAGAERLLGYAASEVVGTHISRLIPQDRSEDFEELLDATLEGQPVRPRDTEWLAADHEPLPIGLSMSPLRNPGGELIGFSVSVRDITERKRAERESERLLAEVRRRERWQAANAEIRLAALSGAPLDDAMQLICERACDLLGAEAALVVSGSAPTTITVAAGTAKGLRGLHMDPLPVDLLHLGPDATTQLTLDAPLLDGPAGEAIGTSPIIAPIATGTKTHALLIVSEPAEPHTSPSPIAVAESLANQATGAIELELARRDTERLLLAEDRERIARDLHDVVIQRLFASGMSLQAVLPLIGDERASERVSAVVDSLDRTIGEIRTAIFALGTPTGDDRLRADIIGAAKLAGEQLGYAPSVRFDGPVDTAVPLEIAAHAVAVVSEALANVVRHARAGSTDVHLSVGDDVVLVVEDDGVGIGTPIRQSGLANMRSRAESLGGSLVITDTPGQGTRLEWRVPTRR